MENAGKDYCRKVWVSFGIFRIMLPFLDGHQIVCLQSANKFCHDIAVCRVNLSIPLPLKYGELSFEPPAPKFNSNDCTECRQKITKAHESALRSWKEWLKQDELLEEAYAKVLAAQSS